MLLPIYIAFLSHEQTPITIIKKRIKTLLQFFYLDTPAVQVHSLLDERGGLVFIEQAQSICSVPLYYQSEKRLTVTAYLPFGAPGHVEDNALCSGRYLPELVDRLAFSPQDIRRLPPPQVWADCNVETQKLTIFNDYRGFGRLYEYVSPFGIVWTNKRAAAPLLAATTARMDEAAWAGFAANGMFYGGGTGFANMSYVLPGTWLEANIRSGLVERRRFSTDTGGVYAESLPASAVEECGAALTDWWRDLGRLTSGQKMMDLSGGRDSRVVAAYALASGLDVKFKTYSPPSQDAALAEQIMALAGCGDRLERHDSRDMIKSSYGENISLTDHAAKILRANNPDVCIATFMDCISLAPAHDSFVICGAQGEVTHPYAYSAEMLEEDAQWQGHDTKHRPSAVRFATICGWISTNAWGVTDAVRATAREKLVQPLLAKAAAANIDGFYLLDFLYLDVYLNRHWAGAVGACDGKTPLTVHPYVRYGFNQPLPSKCASSLVRDIITLAMPQWRDVPFFHELPEQQQHDFHIVHPTWWEMGRGEELAALYASHPDLWKWFDKEAVMNASRRWQADAPETLSPKDTAFRTRCHRCAQRQVWMLAFLQELKELNTVTASLRNQTV